MGTNQKSSLLKIGVSLIVLLVVAVSVFYIFHHNSATNKVNSNNLATVQSINSHHNVPFTLAELASLKNYSFTFIDNGESFNGSVYSPSNWSVQEPVIEEHIGNYIYTKLGTTWFRQLAKNNNYSSSPYMATAKDFLGLYNGVNNKIARGHSCRVANINGTIYTFSSPSVDKPYFTILATSCIANQGHYLLAYYVGTHTNFNDLLPKNISYGLQITGIDQTKALIAPPTFQSD